jgi:hypothetical protein
MSARPRGAGTTGKARSAMMALWAPGLGGDLVSPTQPGADFFGSPRGTHAHREFSNTLSNYWAVDVLQACGARVHLAHPLGVKGFRYRRVKNDVRDAPCRRPEPISDLPR